MAVTISETRIANMALSHIGERQDIEGLDEDTVEAHACELWYHYARLEVLAAYDWSFARARVVLSPHGDTISTTDNQPLAGVWGFRYKYPGDCVNMRKLQHPNAPPGDAIPFSVELNLAKTEKTILTDQEFAVGVYTFDQETVSLFSPHFVAAFSHNLAQHIAFTLTGKIGIKKAMLRAYQGLLLQAPATDANEGVEPPIRDAEWIRGRA